VIALASAGADATNAIKQAEEFGVTKGGAVRADGLMIHDMYLFQVKSSGQSKYPWDYLLQRNRIPGAEAFAPLSASRCPLIAK
jgi:branched-chain amino acid transport system substrate-binding protein